MNNRVKANIRVWAISYVNNAHSLHSLWNNRPHVMSTKCKNTAIFERELFL